MSTSTPSDLSVAFRSLPRRLHQAIRDDTPPASIDAATADVQAAIADAAAELGAVATAEGVAAAIEQRRSVEWTDAELASLLGRASAAARAIRTLENMSEQD